MKTDELVALIICIPVVIGVIGLVVNLFVDETRDALYPRGLRWFPGTWEWMVERFRLTLLRIFYPEKARAFKTHEVLRLESLDNQWRCWAGTSEGGVPEWVPGARGPHVGRWTLRQKPKCPCGYGSECGIWCGSGHADGGCPAHNPEPTAISPGCGARYDR